MWRIMVGEMPNYRKVEAASVGTCSCTLDRGVSPPRLARIQTIDSAMATQAPANLMGDCNFLTPSIQSGARRAKGMRADMDAHVLQEGACNQVAFQGVKRWIVRGNGMVSRK
jgi:hypothetical protein